MALNHHCNDIDMLLYYHDQYTYTSHIPTITISDVDIENYTFGNLSGIKRNKYESACILQRQKRLRKNLPQSCQKCIQSTCCNLWENLNSVQDSWSKVFVERHGYCCECNGDNLCKGCVK